MRNGDKHTFWLAPQTENEDGLEEAASSDSPEVSLPLQKSQSSGFESQAASSMQGHLPFGIRLGSAKLMKLLSNDPSPR